MSFTPPVTSKTVIDQQSQELDLDAILDEAFNELEGFEPPQQTNTVNVDPLPSINMPKETPNLEDEDTEISQIVNELLQDADEATNKERLKPLLGRTFQGDVTALQDLQKEFPEFMSKIQKLLEEVMNPEQLKQKMDAIRQDPKLCQQFITNAYVQFCQMHDIREGELTKDQIVVLKDLLGCIGFDPESPLEASKLEKLPKRISSILIAAEQQATMFQQIQDQNLGLEDKEWKNKVQIAFGIQNYGLLASLLKDFPAVFEMEQDIQVCVIESIKQFEFYSSNKEEFKKSLIKALGKEKAILGWNAQEFKASIDRDLSTFNIQKVPTHSYEDYYIALQIAANEMFISNRKLLEPAVAFCVRLAAATSFSSSPLLYLLTLDEGKRGPLLLQLKNIIISELEQLKN